MGRGGDSSVAVENANMEDVAGNWFTATLPESVVELLQTVKLYPCKSCKHKFTPSSLPGCGHVPDLCTRCLSREIAGTILSGDLDVTCTRCHRVRYSTSQLERVLHTQPSALKTLVDAKSRANDSLSVTGWGYHSMSLMPCQNKTAAANKEAGAQHDRKASQNDSKGLTINGAGAGAGTGVVSVPFSPPKPHMAEFVNRRTRTVSHASDDGKVSNTNTTASTASAGEYDEQGHYQRRTQRPSTVPTVPTTNDYDLVTSSKSESVLASTNDDHNDSGPFDDMTTSAKSDGALALATTTTNSDESIAALEQRQERQERPRPSTVGVPTLDYFGGYSNVHNVSPSGSTTTTTTQPSRPLRSLSLNRMVGDENNSNGTGEGGFTSKRSESRTTKALARARAQQAVTDSQAKEKALAETLAKAKAEAKAKGDAVTNAKAAVVPVYNPEIKARWANASFAAAAAAAADAEEARAAQCENDGGDPCGDDGQNNDAARTYYNKKRRPSVNAAHDFVTSWLETMKPTTPVKPPTVTYTVEYENPNAAPAATVTTATNVDKRAIGAGADTYTESNGDRLPSLKPAVPHRTKKYRPSVNRMI